MIEVKFLEVLGNLSSAFISKLRNLAGNEIAGQVDRVIFPVQKLGGNSEYFSAMIFPFPRLTSQELKDMPLTEEVSFVVKVGSAEFNVDVDHFGQISWIHVKTAPEVYRSLELAMSYVADKGGNTEFWEF